MTKGNLLIGLSVAALMLAPGAALAAHGKAGLWNITTSIGGMPNVQLPPEALAKMKEMGVKMPSARSFASQICMTQAEVDSDKLPPVGKNDMGCTQSSHQPDRELHVGGDGLQRRDERHWPHADFLQRR
jgi:hypothetical protein